MVRAQGPIAASPMDVLKCSFDEEFQADWEENLEFSRVV